jgi:hypothetical protein
MVALVVLWSMAACSAKDGTRQVAEHLQDISVTIVAGDGYRSSSGSGVTVHRGDTTFIWTAGHVVDGLRRTRQVIDPKTGASKTVVEFSDANVVQRLVEGGRTVGKIDMTAEVIRYSGADYGEDLALLRVAKKNFVKASAEFYLDAEIPPIGTPVLHVGSLLGELGSHSMTSGIVSQHGRLINKKSYDQTTAPSFPGSSGGAITLADGRYVGMLVRGAGETFSLYVPIRRMRAWAKTAGVEWAIDPKIKVPPKVELDKMPIEDIGVEFQRDTAAAKKVYPFLLHVLPPKHPPWDDGESVPVPLPPHAAP